MGVARLAISWGAGAAAHTSSTAWWRECCQRAAHHADCAQFHSPSRRRGGEGRGAGCGSRYAARAHCCWYSHWRFAAAEIARGGQSHEYSHVECGVPSCKASWQRLANHLLRSDGRGVIWRHSEPLHLACMHSAWARRLHAPRGLYSPARCAVKWSIFSRDRRAEARAMGRARA